MRPFFLLTLLTLAACAPIPELTPLAPNAQSPFTGYRSAGYASASRWLCRADLPADHCRVDLAATEIRPDGSRALAQHAPAKAPKVDCFYVYPTVDFGVFPDNHTDFSDVAPMADTAAAQAARLGEVCAVYAPLYRQVSIGTFLALDEVREKRLAVAFSDVADAFLHYLGQHNHGRKIALVGHSQGAEMVTRLLQRFFDGDPALRERLLVAMPIGGWVEAPRGRTTGGTFANIPVCTREGELGCVIAYHTHREGTEPVPGRWAPRDGNEAVCVNPASVERNERRLLSRAYFPVGDHGRLQMASVDGVQTPFVLFRDLYAARCVEGPEGYRYLAVAEARGAGDVRESPVNLGSIALNTALGMHVLDLQVAQGELIDHIARRAAALP